MIDPRFADFRARTIAAVARGLRVRGVPFAHCSGCDWPTTCASGICGVCLDDAALPREKPRLRSVPAPVRKRA